MHMYAKNFYGGNELLEPRYLSAPEYLLLNSTIMMVESHSVFMVMEPQTRVRWLKHLILQNSGIFLLFLFVKIITMVWEHLKTDMLLPKSSSREETIFQECLSMVWMCLP